MFLIRLNRPQAVALLSLAHELVSADSVTTVGELTRIADMRRELGISPDEEIELITVDAAAAALDSRSVQLIAVFELVDLCCADRRISVLEAGLIRRLATIWRLDERILADIEGWVQRYRQLMGEALDMIAGRG